jgi:NAD(P)-dependent dehydrogenase (short-subunit alcohol dehydrogenase family)
MGVLEGRKALITGGSSGIGRATALLFAEEGAMVSVVDIDREGGEAVAAAITGKGGKALFLPCDVSLSGECRGAVEKTVDNFDGLDILFNNAGIIHRATLLDTTEEDWERAMAVNVRSVFLMSRFAIPFMIDSGGGVIINSASGWGLVGGKKAASYCASKGAVVQLTRAMALDHGGQGIRVNCVCPGDIDTPMLQEEARQLDTPISEFLAEAADRPLGRTGTPEDIARAVLYLASDASAFVTGTTLVVDGGGLAG